MSTYAQKTIRKNWRKKDVADKRTATMLWLITQKDLPKNELRIALYVAMRWDFENWLPLPQAEIADELGMLASHVTTAIKGLKNRKLIVRTRTKPHKHRIELATIDNAIRRGP